MNWEKISEHDFEASNSKYHFYLRLEKNGWCLDIFDVNVKSHEEAYVESKTFNTKQESIEYSENY